MNQIKYEGQLNGTAYRRLIGTETEVGTVRNKFNIFYGTLISVTEEQKEQN